MDGESGNGSGDEARRRHIVARRVIAAYRGDTPRQQLIAEAMTVHRAKQSVLGELDENQRRRLAAAARAILSPPDGGES